MTEPHSDPLVDALQQFRSVAASALALAIVLARESARRTEQNALDAQRAAREQARWADAERAGRGAMKMAELERYIRSDPIGAAQAWVGVEMNKAGDPKTARLWETAMRNLGIDPKTIREEAERIANASQGQKLTDAEAGAAVGRAQRSQAQEDAKFSVSDFRNEADVSVPISKQEVLKLVEGMPSDALEATQKQTGRRHDAYSWLGKDGDVDRLLLHKFPQMAQDLTLAPGDGSGNGPLVQPHEGAGAAAGERLRGEAGQEDHAATQAGAQDQSTAQAGAAEPAAHEVDDQTIAAGERAAAAGMEAGDPAPGAWRTGQDPARLAGQGHAVGPAEAMSKNGRSGAPKGSARGRHRAGPTRDRGRGRT